MSHPAESSFSFVFQIPAHPPARAGTRDFITWKSNAAYSLKAAGLWEHVSGFKQFPLSPSHPDSNPQSMTRDSTLSMLPARKYRTWDAYFEAVENWYLGRDKALFMIWSFLDEELKPRFAEHTNPMDLWIALMLWFEDEEHLEGPSH